MSILTSITRAITKPFPKMLPPKAHATADVIIAGTFLVAGAVYWRRNKRAALGALACGGTHLATSLLTGYGRRRGKPISLRLHKDMELGMAAMIAAMPEFLHFEEDREKRFFLLQAAAITALTNLTDFEPAAERGWLESRAA